MCVCVRYGALRRLRVFYFEFGSVTYMHAYTVWSVVPYTPAAVVRAEELVLVFVLGCNCLLWLMFTFSSYLLSYQAGMPSRLCAPAAIRKWCLATAQISNEGLVTLDAEHTSIKYTQRREGGGG